MPQRPAQIGMPEAVPLRLQPVAAETLATLIVCMDLIGFFLIQRSVGVSLSLRFQVPTCLSDEMRMECFGRRQAQSLKVDRR